MAEERRTVHLNEYFKRVRGVDVARRLERQNAGGVPRAQVSDGAISTPTGVTDVKWAAEISSRWPLGAVYTSFV